MDQGVSDTSYPSHRLRQSPRNERRLNDQLGRPEMFFIALQKNEVRSSEIHERKAAVTSHR